MARRTPSQRRPAGPPDAAAPIDPDDVPDADLEAHLRLVLAAWPQVDPDVEAIVTRLAKAHGYVEAEARASLARAGLTKEEFKVLLTLHRGNRSHGSLCRELKVTTGAMTNRLDKLERSGFVSRSRDPTDRRGILLELTPRGHDKLEECVDTGAHRERELLSALRTSEKRQLNTLLQKLLAALEAETGGP